MTDRPRSFSLGTGPPRRVRYQDLTRRRVHRILLVSSLYDSFILAEDGQLSQAFLTQFLDLNLAITPDLTRVSSGAEALKRIRAEGRFDLIITSLQVGDMDALELATKVRDAGMNIPVVLLAYDNRELTDFKAKRDMSPLERSFLWQGDVRILLAMVKYVEDRWNVAWDTGVAGVPAVIVVEDNIRFYSAFLPVIFTEVVKHTQGLISEGLNLYQKMIRLRVRPKILLCETYEEAWDYFSTYGEHVLGIISDIEFPRGGKPEREAGVELAREVRKIRSDVPIMLQSSLPKNKALADSVGAMFLLKGSPVLLQQLRKFMLDNFGFGPFVFHMPDESIIDEAADLKSLVQKLSTVPVESIAFHGGRNHFSIWLKARGEFALAQKLRPRKVTDYATVEDLRFDLIRSIGDYQRERDRVVVADFNRKQFDTSSSITRIGGGSLGGKARGLAFINRLLLNYGVAEKFPEIRIKVPQSVVLATDVFDEFLSHEGLQDLALYSDSDEEIRRRFIDAPFPNWTRLDLRSFLAAVRRPLAVRSSGLLEDSPNQPFAGVYQTYMLPNNDPDIEVRLSQLLMAVKCVYASTFSQQAKGFLNMTSYRLEEEKMAVIVQAIVGAAHETRFYPDLSGVARSHNFYPTPPLQAEDGIVAVALGLGRTVVEGETCLRFCSKYPRHLPAFSSVDDALKNSQREFYALDLEGEFRPGEEAELRRFDLTTAERDGTLGRLGSTYSPDNDAIYDGTSRPGVRLVTFAPVLKHGVFPLADLIGELLSIAEDGTSSAVEIEFAANLGNSEGTPCEFGFLQMRPMALSSEAEEIEIGEVLTSQLICRSGNVLGNGRIDGIRDIVVVDRHRFDRHRSVDAGTEVGRFNAALQGAGLPYLLVGVGRWGSADPYLGIPVGWNQIAGARVIVEAGFRDFRVTPSQGTHFFQNLTSCNVGYFTVNSEMGEGFVDWDWLLSLPVVGNAEFVRHIRLDEPMLVKMSGHTGEGVILKPA
jgi:CheY-like chemotaxis protein